MNNSVARKFFIVGCGRSGTSLLQRLLSSHSNIILPPETGYFSLIVPEIERRYRFPLSGEEQLLFAAKTLLSHERTRSIDITIKFLVSKLNSKECVNAGDLLAAFMDCLAERSGVTVCGEKTPRHVLNLSQIKSEIPGARVIYMVRDPRAVAASFKEVNAAFGSKNVVTAIRQWKDAANAFHFMRNVYPEWVAENVIVISYEELIKAPEEILARIVAFLGEDNEVLSTDASEDKLYHHGQEQHMKNTNKALFSDSIKKWRSSLTGIEVRAIEYAESNAMRYFGYPVNAKSRWVSGLAYYVMLFLWPFERVSKKIMRNFK